MANTQAPIIIKRIKKISGGHHGGAWKVAYADFVTAMMAFFLLLWLLNATTEDQKQGIADYFNDPFAVSKSNSGAGGVFGGQSMRVEGSAIGEAPPIVMEVPIDNRPIAVETPSGEAGGQVSGIGEAEAGEMHEAEARAAEEARFEAAAADLLSRVQAIPELAALRDQLMVDLTPEGLRIQVIDREGRSMFPSGSAAMNPHSQQLLELVAEAVRPLSNRISIRGHTDATPFIGDGSYTNWDLSADRANASRRVLVASGVPPARIANIVGKADGDPLFPEDPERPGNRRISILLLSESPAAMGEIGRQ